MNYKKHIIETLKLALPVSIGFLGHIMLNVVDSVMIGKIGASHLAASSLVGGLFLLVMVLGLGLSVAITPLVAFEKGSDNLERCGIILRQGLLVNTVFSILLLLISYFTAELIHFMNQPEDVSILAESYMKIFSYSMVPLMIFQTFKQFIEGLGDTKPAMYVNISANLINAFANWVLIFGNLGFPRLELDGAGYASLITRFYIALVLVIYVVRAKKYKMFDASFHFKSINWSVIKKIINIGIPTGLQMFFEVGVFSFAAIMIGWMGTKYLAAHQIAINLASISFMIILGIASAATIRVGNFLGKRDYTELKKASNTALLFGIGVMSSFAVLFILLRFFLPTLYIDDPVVINLAAGLLVYAALFQVFDGTQAIGLGVLRGMTDVTIPMIIAFIAYWVIGIPIGYILGFNLGLEASGVWMSLTLGLIVAAIFFTLRIHKNIKTYFRKAMEENQL
jgi:MATE family multidrug resistance protein